MSEASAILAEDPEERPFGRRPFWPRRNWWLALLAILVLAGALRYPGYDFGLPHVDEVDVTHFFLSGRMIIDFGTARPMNFHHYPPGIIQIYYVAMRLFQDPSLPPASVLGIVRFLAVTTSLGAIAVFGLLGYHAAGPLVGLSGAALWSITPLFVERSRWGSAEIWVLFFSTLALYFTTVAILYRRESWSTHATYALMLAIVFKYHCVFIAPLVLLAPLWRGRVPWKRVLGNLGRFALFSFWLLFLTPALEFLDPIPEQHAGTWVRHTRVVSDVSPLTLVHNLTDALGWLDYWVLIPGWLGLGLLFWDRSYQRRARHALVFLFAALFLWLAGISLFGKQGIHAIRLLFSWVALLVMLSGWGYSLILQGLYRSLAPQTPQRRNLAVGLAAALVLAIQIPNVLEAVEQTRYATLPDQRNELAQWADQTLPANLYIASPGNTATLNREWGGYPGQTPFQYTGSINAEITIEEWRAQGVRLAIVDHFLYELWQEEGTKPFFTETTLLKSYPPSDAHRGPAMVVLLLQTIQHSATGQLGPIRLLGYDLTVESASPGDALPLHLYWEATAATEADYQVFNHLLDGAGNLVAQADGPPLPDPLLRRGTKDWDDPEEIFYSREYLLALPEDLAPGEYTLVSGFYRRDNGQRLLSPAGEDALWVTRIMVQ